MKHLTQWINWRLVPDAAGGKPDKVPFNIVGNHQINPHDPTQWLTFDEAARRDPAHIGFVLTEADPYFCIDLDHAWNGTAWSSTSLAILACFPGAYVEVSYSGDGFHIFGQGAAPDGYGTRNKQPDGSDVECYTKERFIAYTGTNAYGDADTLHDLAGFAALYLKPGDLDNAVNGWTTKPVPEYTPFPSDDLLIKKMIGSRDSAGVAFGGKASAADLWSNNMGALVEVYPGITNDSGRSEADAALATHLAFWTGRNCEHVERLMRLSGMVRPKWDDHKSYLRRTIAGAVSLVSKVYTGLPLPEPGSDLGFAASPETHSIIAGRGTRLVRFRGDWLTREAGGFYRAIDEELIRKEIRASSNTELTTTRVNNSLDELKSATVIDGHGRELPFWLTEYPNMPPARDLIVCRNGILDPATGTLHAHSDEMLTLNALTYDYDPNAPEPTGWLRFLAEVFDSDAESVGELQKMFGYLLTLDTSLQKIFAIIGPKRSGKGTIGRVLRSLIGIQNCCGPSFTKMSGDFGLQSFIGSQLAIIADARIGHRTDRILVAERLLSISGEDALDINRKHRIDWSGKLNTRLLVLSNELPALPDPSGSLAGRFVAFHTPVSFFGREDRTLTDKLLTEMPGILNWSLEGLRRLRADGRIVTPVAARDLIEGIEALGSPAKAFFADRCKLADGDVSKDLLWSEYRRWHVANSIPSQPLSKEMFGRALKTAFAGVVKDYRPRDDAGNRAMCWSGLTLTGTAPINYSDHQPPFGQGTVRARSG